jgi:hypothetical protein
MHNFCTGFAQLAGAAAIRSDTRRNGLLSAVRLS